MQPLAEDGLRCIAYDRRAHGRSSDPGSRYDFDELADDLNCVIEALSLRGVTLVAHSFASIATLGMMNLTSHQALLAMSRIQSTTDFRSNCQGS
jgi:pimeloyl-ACP methyl ester carboxylesterase